MFKTTFQLIKKTIFSAIVFLPSIVFATHDRHPPAGPQTLSQLIERLVDILDALIPLLVGLALAGFIWGGAEFILHSDDSYKRKEGSVKMAYGIIALFAMISIWGLVKVLAVSLGVDVTFIPRL